MSTTLQHRRGSAANHTTFTGSIAEVTYDTTDKRLVAHDGATAGGIPHALESEVTTVANGLSTLGGRVTALEGANGLVPQGPVIVPSERLIIKYVTAATVDVDATAVTLFDINATAKRFTTVNVTINITASGAAGLDTGAEASSTWYHIWGIGKSDGTFSAMVSTSATSGSITLPATYTYFGYLGAVYNDGSSNFATFLQQGNEVYTSWTVTVSAGSATTYTSVSLTSLVPSTAVGAYIITGAYQTTTAAVTSLFFSDATGSGTTPGLYEWWVAGYNINSPAAYYSTKLLLNGTQSYKYRLSGGTAPRANQYCFGWSF